MSKKEKNKIIDIISEEKFDSGYSIPKNYFNSLEEQFSNNLFEKTLPKKTGFKTPEGYFNCLEDNLSNKINKQTKIISLQKKLLTWIPSLAAACIIVFIGLNFSTSTNELTDEDIILWFENRNDRLTDLDLAQAFDETDFENDDFTSNLSALEIENYLNTKYPSSILEVLE